MNRLLGCLFLVVLLASSSGWADDFTAVPRLAPPKLRFDEPSGYFGEWKTKISCPINAVRTAARMDVARPTNSYWNPNVGVFLYSGRQSISVMVMARHNAMPPFRVLLRKAMIRGDDLVVGKPQFQLYKMRVSPGERVPIAVDWTADGRVSVHVRSESLAFDFGAAVDTLKFGAAHGVGVLDPILVGYTGTEKTAREACRVIALTAIQREAG